MDWTGLYWTRPNGLIDPEIMGCPASTCNWDKLFPSSKWATLFHCQEIEELMDKLIIAVANPGLTFLVLSFSLAKLPYFGLMPEIQNVWENHLHGSPPSALELDLIWQCTVGCTQLLKSALCQTQLHFTPSWIRRKPLKPPSLNSKNLLKLSFSRLADCLTACGFAKTWKSPNILNIFYMTLYRRLIGPVYIRSLVD